MKHPFPHRKHSCARRLDPVTAGLFFAASMLFAVSFVCYFLSLIPIL